MILILGGAGYIGSHVNKQMNRLGYETIVFDNLKYGHKEFVKWGRFYPGDLGNDEEIDACFNKYPIKAVMHFSAYAYVGESVVKPSEYYFNNVVNTLKVLNKVLKYDVKYFVFSSSCATYGIPNEIPINEEHPQLPINPYGKSKLMVEEILKDFEKAYGINYISLRYFNAAGADPDGELGEWHEPETHLIPLVLDVALGRRNGIEIFGTDYNTPDGTCIRDYIHVQDLANAHVSALKYLFDGGKSDVFNLGNGKGFSVREVIGVAKSVTGKDIKVIESKKRKGDPPILVGSSAKAFDILGWSPQYTKIEDIIQTAWKWHQKVFSKNNSWQKNID
ncbi:MAG: UDP-glucose 4-epimerase GalE [Nitrospirota bacterium]